MQLTIGKLHKGLLATKIPPIGVDLPDIEANQLQNRLIMNIASVGSSRELLRVLWNSTEEDFVLHALPGTISQWDGKLGRAVLKQGWPSCTDPACRSLQGVQEMRVKHQTSILTEGRGGFPHAAGFPTSVFV